MDFTLSPELRELRSRVRALVDDVLAPLAPEAEQNGGRLSDESHARVKRAVLEAGLNAANIPTEYGGGGLGLTEQIVMHEQLGRLTNCLWVLVWSPSNVLVHGTPAQIERYLLPDVRGEHRHAYAITEEQAGSDARGIRAEAVRDGDVYRLSGTKSFATDGDVALCHRFAGSDASRAIQSMMLTALSDGVGFNWVGFGGLEETKPVLGVPEDLDILAILPFGYPVDAVGRGKKQRKPLGEVAYRERYGQPWA